MEGAGLYVSSADHRVDWIVVKAICDWADGNKKKNKTQRQKKAAKNAAEFVVGSLKCGPLKRLDSQAGQPNLNSPSHSIPQQKAVSGTPALTAFTTDPSGRVVYSKQSEWLYTNLLKVAKLPKRIYTADTPHRFGNTVWSALRKAGGNVGPEWLLVSKRIISFQDLRAEPWNNICDQKPVQVCDTAEWSETDDLDRRRDFVRLLNICLGEFARSLDLCYQRRLDCYVFPATPDLQPKTL